VTLGILGVVVGLLPVLHGRAPRMSVLLVGLFLAAFGLAAPAVLYWPNRIWHAFGVALGRITNPVVLTVAYLLILTPLGCLRRLLGHDGLRRRWDPGAASYWQPRPAEPAIDFKRQF
jgi:hypothetical protein